jgi:hypothetical protein
MQPADVIDRFTTGVRRKQIQEDGIVYLIALMPALFGLPLHADARLHHILLAWLIVALLIAANIVCARLGMLRGRTALASLVLVFCAPAALILNLIALDALVADEDKGFAFVASLLGVDSKSVRGALVVLMALTVFAMAATVRLALYGEKRAARDDSAAPLDEAEIGGGTARPTLGNAAEEATDGAEPSRKRWARRQAASGHAAPRTSAPSSARARSPSDAADAASEPAAPIPPAAEPDPAPPIDIWSGATRTDHPATSAGRARGKGMLWVAVGLVVVVVLSVTWFWTGQGVADGACKPAVLERSTPTARADKLRRAAGSTTREP